MTAPRYPIPEALASMSIDGHHVVEASAGTGKTYLIEHRVLQLVAAGVPLERILVVTFTEKATAELRARVRRLLERALGARDDSAGADEPHISIDDTARARLRDALSATDAAPIFTIHGFCQRVLTENAFWSRRPFEQTLVSAETAFSTAFRAALRERFAACDDLIPYLRAYLRGGKTVSDLETLLFRAHTQQAELRPRFEPARIGAAARDAARAIREAGAGRGAEEVCRAAKVHASTRKALAKKLDELAEILAGLEGASALEVCAALSGDSRDKLEYILDKLPRGADAALDGAAEALAELDESLCPVEAATAQALLPEVSERLRRDKDRRGELDFGDLLTFVWESLSGEDGDALAESLRRRYPHALIDEFQDTDAVQWSIFRRLYLEATGGASLAIIGDPKQAIYGFRGADVATYLRACREVAHAGGRSIRLPKNYRASPALVRACNDLVGSADHGPFFTGGIRYDEPVTAARRIEVRRDGQKTPPARVFRLRPAEGEKPTAFAIARALRRRIADEIGALLGERPLEIDEEDGARRVRARDIFVLTRSRHESEEIADALRRAGIPCALYQQEGLFASAEATEVYELFLGIAQPDRQAARLRAWQTRFFDVPVAELPALADAGDAHPLVAPLRHWHALAAGHRYEELFSAIMTESGVIERELFADSSERSLTNFQHIFEILAAEVSRSRGSIHELTQRLGGWVQRAEEGGPGADTDLQRLESEADAVQIMTIHKSKGLEADVVFLYGGYGDSPHREVSLYREGERRVAHVGKPRGAAAEAIAAENRAEEQRLSYVAITRAAAALYLPLYPQSKGALSQLGDRLAGLLAGGGGEAGAKGRLAPAFAVEDLPLALESATDDEAPPDADPLAGWQPPRALLEPPSSRPALSDPARAGFVMTSYSRLKRQGVGFAIEATGDPAGEEEDLRAAFELAPGELGPGAASGIFLHEILESIDFDSAKDAPDFETWRQDPRVRAIFDRAMVAHARDPAERDHSEAMVHRALTTPVAPIAMPSLAARDRDRREVEFLFPLPGGADRGFLNGFLDLVFDWRGKSYVLDWKSDLLADYSAEAAARHAEAHYHVQATIYALALVKMLGIRDDDDYEARFGGVVYWFLRGAAPDGSGVYAVRPSPDALRAAEAELGEAAPR